MRHRSACADHPGVIRLTVHDSQPRCLLHDGREVSPLQLLEIRARYEMADPAPSILLELEEHLVALRSVDDDRVKHDDAAEVDGALDHRVCRKVEVSVERPEAQATNGHLMRPRPNTRTLAL